MTMVKAWLHGAPPPAGDQAQTVSGKLIPAGLLQTMEVFVQSLNAHGRQFKQGLLCLPDEAAGFSACRTRLQHLLLAKPQHPHHSTGLSCPTCG